MSRKPGVRSSADAVGVVGNRRRLDRRLAVDRAQQRGAQVDHEQRVDDAQQVVGGLAARVTQEARGTLREVDDRVLVGDDHRRRREALDQL
jgi:flavin-dependent dehydrogenase